MGILDRVKAVEDGKDPISYKQGFDDGKIEGREEGYKQGYADAKAKYKQKKFYDPLTNEER